ncbi:hypothetical protein BDW74DRAFT_145826 [Aspergillus multicolor]|uniref:uncharacterized protein n=1 Tax=Aspergillus multicolor TaxID=41759 RepID=UPI003CCE439B
MLGDFDRHGFESCADPSLKLKAGASASSLDDQECGGTSLHNCPSYVTEVIKFVGGLNTSQQGATDHQSCRVLPCRSNVLANDHDLRLRMSPVNDIWTRTPGIPQFSFTVQPRLFCSGVIHEIVRQVLQGSRLEEPQAELVHSAPGYLGVVCSFDTCTKHVYRTDGGRIYGCIHVGPAVAWKEL